MFLIVLFFGIIILGFSGYGLISLFNYVQINSKLDMINKKNILFNNLFSDFEYDLKIDSTKNYKDFIYYFNKQTEIQMPDRIPINGFVTRGVNLNNNHYGIDIAAKKKDNIFSPDDGRVIFSGMSEDLGNTIIIAHPKGFITVFAHNDTNLVKSGVRVEKGDIIAFVGETGNSEGPHLHFELWKNNEVLDPREIFPEYKKKDVSIR